MRVTAVRTSASAWPREGPHSHTRRRRRKSRRKKKKKRERGDEQHVLGI
jgi:hypothetical protein